MSRLGVFLAELRRRRVDRVAVAYAVAGLAVLEGADVLVPALSLPGRLVTFVAVVALAGFPLALFLAWRYQITPDGAAAVSDGPTGSQPFPVLPIVAAGATVAFVAFALGWLLGPGAEPPGRAGGIPIAVLPFAHLGDPGDAFFTDGLHEEIITRLSHLPGLRVTSRTSVMGYRADPKPVRDIATELGVEAVLEGTVRRAGTTLRMTAQLIDARRDEHLWSATYDRAYSMEAILAVQGDVANEVSSALRLVLGSDPAGPSPPTSDLEAYELYLLGRHHWNARTPEDLRRAISRLQEAASRDSAFAQAWAGLADAYAVLPAYDATATTGASMPLARQAAERALALDPSLAEAHASLGFVAFTYDWRPGEAEDRFDRALALNPSHAPALYWRGWLLGLLGRPDEARQSLERALALAPRSVAALFSTGSAYMLMGDYAEGKAALERAVELDPGFAPAWTDLASAAYLTGDAEAARTAWIRYAGLRGWPGDVLGAVELLPGEGVSARPILRGALPPGTLDGFEAIAALPLYALAGDTSAVLELMERAHQARLPGVIRFYQLPYFRDYVALPEAEALTAAFRRAFGPEPGAVRNP